MVKLIVLMEALQGKPVAVCFKNQEQTIRGVFSALGLNISSHEVEFILTGKGSLLSAAAKEIDEREEAERAQQDSLTSGGPGGSGGLNLQDLKLG